MRRSSKGWLSGTWLAIAMAALTLNAQQTPPAGGGQQQDQDRDRVQTPGTEPSGQPKKDQDKKKDQSGTQAQDRTRTPGTPSADAPKRDRVHTPGTGTSQPAPKGGSRGSGGGRR